MEYISHSEAETEAFGERLAAALSPGAVVAYRGGLGMGKTAFTRGLARGLGCRGRVTSPTFTIVNEYEGPTPLFHFDMYRLNGSEDLFDIGWEDYLSRGGVCAVEWSEQVADALPEGTVSAAVTEDGKVLCSGYQDTGLTHSRTLMPIVEAMLKNTGLTVQDCDAVAVAAGPGSFTGIRIGVSAAKGLAFAADKPCAAVSTLEAMARNVAHMDALVVCAMDARRSQIYNALFTSEHGRLTRRTPDRAIGLAELAEMGMSVRIIDQNEQRCVQMSERLPKALVIVGDGAVLCEKALTESGLPCRLAPPQLVMQNAMSVALCAEDLARAGKLVSAQELLPVYLRPPQAQRLRQPPQI